MSRKSSKPPKLELVRDDDADPATPDDEHVYRIVGRAQAIFDSLVFADVLVQRGPSFETAFRASLDTPEFAALVNAQAGEIGLAPDADDLEAEEAALAEELDRLDAMFADFESSIDVLAHALIAEVLGKPLDSDVLADIGGRTIDNLVRQFDPSLYPDVFHARRNELEDASNNVDAIVHEIGLEEFEVFARFCSASDGSLALYAEPLPPLNADIYLLDFVFDSAIDIAADNETIILVENVASGWEFDRWSVRLEADSVPELQREIRREDYRLLDRPMVTLGASLIDLMAQNEGGIRIHPRQVRLAAALTESFVDVFEVTQLEGTRATWKSVIHGTLYEVHEHAAAAKPYEPGWVVAGRLIPFDGTLHLRSPGAVFAPPEPGLAQRAANTFSRLEESIHPALALEAAISTDFLGVAVPIEKKPMPSRSKARIVLEDLEMRIADGLTPDATLTAYRKALKRQAESPSDSSKKSKPKKRKR